MSLLDKKLGLVFLLALFFVRCEDPSELGLELNPNTNNVVVNFVEFPLEPSIVLLDSINTSNMSRLLVGRVDDASFGTTVAETYTTIRPEIFGVIISEDATFDSARLNLSLNYSYGFDTTQIQTIRVHELTDTFDVAFNYATDQTAFEFDPVGEISTVVSPGTDTLVSIPLEPSKLLMLFNLIAGRTPATVTDQATFNSFYEGLALTYDNSNSLILGFDAASIDTRMTLYYSEPGDTIPFAYDFFFNLNQYNSIRGDRSGTPIQQLQLAGQEINPVNDLIYSQTGTGVGMKLDFQPFLDFIDSFENLTVNQAQLKFGPLENFEKGLEPPDVLIINLLDSLNSISSDDDLEFNEIINSNPLFLLYDEEENLFEGDLTGYLQLVSTQDLQGQTLLTVNPLDFTAVITPLNLRALSVNRYIVNKDKITLRLFYTTFD